MLSNGRSPRRSVWLLMLVLAGVAWLAAVGAFVTVWVLFGWLT